MATLTSLQDYKIPSLPRAALQTLELVQDPDVDIQRLSRAIEKDPALSSRIVRLSNSSLFGLSREVASIRQAIVMLGLRTVKLATISFTLVNPFPRKNIDPRLSTIWRRVLTDAMGARIAAPLFDLDPEECFLAGLLQDLSMLILAETFGNDYFDLIVRGDEDGTPLLHELEQERFGVTHAQLGARLLDEWKLPGPLVEAVATHHDCDVPARLREAREGLPVLMGAAETVTAFLLQPTGQHFEAFNDVSEAFGESSAEMDKFLQQLELHVGEMADLLELSLPEGQSYEQVFRDARHAADQMEELDPPTDNQLVDPQSGLLHADAIPFRCKQELALAKRQGWPLSIVIIRVTPISRLQREDKLDLAIELVRTLGTNLQQLTRESDTVFRHGSQTFCILMGNTSEDAAITAIERIHNGVHDIPVDGLGPDERTNATYGVMTVTPSEGRSVTVDAKELIELVEESVRLAAEEGGFRMTSRTI